jgi:2-amino-4-hydroxy-6-hydroxymethyldihydropteridine diphosphokinase
LSDFWKKRRRKRLRYEDWKPFYLEICSYFCFNPEEDEKAARILAELTSSDATPVLHDLISGNNVTVCGNAPVLSSECNKADGVIIAADAATGVLLNHQIKPDVIVTDLDGIDDYAVDLNKSGSIVVIHAHGDNIPRLYNWVPKFKGPVVCTTQGKPFANLYNYGGFTDGDRAVFLAHEMGAVSVKLLGFDCNDPNVAPMKKGKLLWAKKLLKSLGYEC